MTKEPPNGREEREREIQRALHTMITATVNQHPPAHHPLDARYYSVMDEPQLS
jgi:hypothetical protein